MAFIVEATTAAEMRAAAIREITTRTQAITLPEALYLCSEAALAGRFDTCIETPGRRLAPDVIQQLQERQVHVYRWHGHYYADWSGESPFWLWVHRTFGWIYLK